MRSGTPTVAAETLGQRIARLRTSNCWTQQELADRVAISRVAISHLEMGISVPSERTIALLAGAFHIEPLELVEDTSYPLAKAERLPLSAARYTEVELQIALMQRDLAWSQRVRCRPGGPALVQSVQREWRCRLESLVRAAVDPRERRLLETAQAEVEAEAGVPGHSAP